MASLGWALFGRRRKVRHGRACAAERGKAGEAGRDTADHVGAWQARIVWSCFAMCVLARHCPAGKVRPGPVCHCRVWRGSAGTVRCRRCCVPRNGGAGLARKRVVPLCVAWFVPAMQARSGRSVQGSVGLGKAGMAGLDTACLGKAQHCRHGLEMRLLALYALVCRGRAGKV